MSKLGQLMKLKHKIRKELEECSLTMESGRWFLGAYMRDAVMNI